MAPMGKGRGQGVAGTGTQLARGLFLLEVSGTWSSGQQDCPSGWPFSLPEASWRGESAVPSDI